MEENRSNKTGRAKKRAGCEWHPCRSGVVARLEALRAILVPAPFFLLLAVWAKGRTVLREGLEAVEESKTNLLIHFLDVIALAPLLVLLATIMQSAFQAAGLVLVSPDTWSGLSPTVVAVIAIVLGDFIGYWRHRLEHTAALWPTHAIHHSDTAMTWTTLFRFHPLNRLTTTLIDTSALALLGLPPYALAANLLVRHYYGMFIHMDLPWTYGPLCRVLVSPAMHRWHHVRDADGAGANFATVFSVFDQAFRTYHVPGPCTVPLGVRDDMGKGVVGQLAYPFRPSRYTWVRAPSAVGGHGDDRRRRVHRSGDNRNAERRRSIPPAPFARCIADTPRAGRRFCRPNICVSSPLPAHVSIVDTSH